MKYHNIPTLFDNQASLINGKNIGTDSVRYIQDAGQKTAGTTYIDRNTNELYVCVTTTDSVNNDGNFSKFNLKEAFNKLDSLDLFLIGTDLNYTNKGSYILPKKLNKKYKFILVLSSAILNTSQNEFMKSIYIPYQFKHHQWASYGNSNAGDYTEAICFYFENDEKLIIPYSLKSGIDQTMIRAIYQF